MAVQREQWISPEEYLAIDRASPDVKYEYMDGHMYAIAGGSRNHAPIAMNLGTIVDAHLGDGPCRAYSSDVRAKVSESKYLLPDLTVTCSPEDMPGEEDMIYSPRLVVEVLSPSTELNDRTWKLQNYTAHPTIEEYLLVDSRAMRIEIYRKEQKKWIYDAFEADDEVELTTLGVHFPIVDTYEDVIFGNDE